MRFRRTVHHPLTRIGLGSALLIPAAVAELPGEALQQQVAALKDRVAPSADDWITETAHLRAKHQLEALADVLADASPPAATQWMDLFADGMRLARLRPDEWVTIPRPPFEVRRPRGHAWPSDPRPPGRALAELVAPFRKPVRVAFKIVQVSAIIDGCFETTAYYQASGAAEGGVLQQNAVWQIDWQGSIDEAHPRITAIRVSEYEECLAPGPVLVDRTREVIVEDDDWYPHLALGSNTWHGKLDAVGEINFMGHEGIAIGDANGDGLDDVYVALGQGLPNKLFIQQPDGTALDRAADAGVDWLDATKGVLLVDLDNDGDQDFLAAVGPAVIVHRNDGSGRFQPISSMKAPTPAAFYGLCAGDYDADGDLDLYATRYVKVRYGVSVPVPFHDANNGPTNHLLRNDGQLNFTDVTAEVGLDVNNERFSLAATWVDFDGDGDLDLYVANDFGRNNLYLNDGGRFRDVAAEMGAEDQAAGMGVTWCDYDLDGDLDVYVSNMFSSAGRRIAYLPRFMEQEAAADRAGAQRHSLGNTLLRNDGAVGFVDVSDSAGVRMGRWAWGARFVDFNNDGADDLLVPNGFLTNDRLDDL